MQATLHIRLLGGFQASVGEQTLAVPAGKVQSLLAYLLLYPRVDHPREMLAELLWPELSPTRKRRNLSDTLYRLRQLMPGDWLSASATAVGLRAVDMPWVDVWAFEEAVKDEAVERLRAALDLYAGDLLPEIYIDWIWTHRIALQEKFVDGTLRIAAQLEQQGNLQEALARYLRVLQVDKVREEAHRGHIRMLARMGRLTDALDAYDRLVDLLDQELGVPPDRETRDLAEHLFRELELARQTAALRSATLLRPPFAGRAQERALLLAVVERAVQGQGAMAAVGGQAGIGKTRLLEEVESGARWRGAAVVWGRASEEPTASPLAPLAEALAVALAGPRAAQIESLVEPAVLAACAPLYPAWQDLARLPELPPDLARTRFVRGAGVLLSTLGDITPLVILLDDLHWADPALWLVLDELAPLCPESRLVILFSFRRPEIEEAPAWQIVQRWEREGLLALFHLDVLSPTEVKQLLPSERSEDSEALWAATGGTPFYLVQALATQSEGAGLPSTVQARAAQLPPEARAALEAAAVLGRRIPYHLWAAIAQMPARTLIAAGEQLVQKLLLTPVESGYTFVHDLVHEAIYTAMPAARRQALHARAAHVLAIQDAANARGRAYHLERAGLLPEAGEQYAEVARQARAIYAFAEAKAALDKALAFLPAAPAPRHVRLLLDAAQLCDILGDAAGRRDALERAVALVDLLREPALELEVAIQAADLAAKIGDHEVARRHFQTALELATTLDDRQRRIDVLLAWADLNARVGDYATAHSQFEEAATLASARGDVVAEGRALEGKGWVMAGMGVPVDEVIATLETALRLHEAGEDRFELARTRLSLLSLMQAAGRLGRCLELADDVLASLHQVGYRRGEAAARQALALVNWALGNYAAAAEQATAAAGLFASIDDRLGVAVARGSLGLIARDEGNLEVARQELESSLAIAERLGSHVHAAFARQDLGTVLLAQGHRVAAAAHLEQAVAVWSENGDEMNRHLCEIRLAEAWWALGREDAAREVTERHWAAFTASALDGGELLSWYGTLVTVLERSGQRERAAAVADAAYRELLRQAALLPPALRPGFLRAPGNRALVDAHDAYRGTRRSGEVTLTCVDVPLGRKPAPAEQKAITWTLSAPEDELITDPAVRRQHILKRLADEAAAQGVAPTDDELAQALGVSRRTVLRDIQTLANQNIHVSTRARGL